MVAVHKCECQHAVVTAVKINIMIEKILRDTHTQSAIHADMHVHTNSYILNSNSTKLITNKILRFLSARNE